MLKNIDIKNGTFVYNEKENTYGYLIDVGNAIEKGDRDEFSTQKNELSYSIVDILNGEIDEGICEHSYYSNILKVATINDIDTYFNIIEADSIIELGKAQKNNAMVKDAINKFEKLKLQNNEKTIK